MIVRTRKETDVSSLKDRILVREMVRLEDGMNIRLFDLELSSGTEFSLSELLEEETYTAALFGVSGELEINAAQQLFHLKSDQIIGLSSQSPCHAKALSPSIIIVVACPNSKREGVLTRSLSEIENSERSVEWGNGLSQRFLVERDSFGFALCYTIGNPDTDSNLQYKNHLEACYYLSGTGEYIWQENAHPIHTDDGDATMFVMDQHDQHRMRIENRSVCISVFSPPISGHEKHDFSASEPSVY